MRVKLTDKISTYAPATLRARFMPGCQWLGTVVVDDGRRGALMLTPDGHYFMVSSFNRTTRLNAELTALAVAEAMAPVAVPVPRPAGRPPQHGEPMLHRMVSLPTAAIEHARRIGQGNISAGVRTMVLDYLERNHA